MPYQLGVRPRFVVDRVESGGRRTVHYPLTAPGRGRYRIGPLSVRLTDPFGFCELTRSFTASDELLVTPTLWQLPPSRLGGDWTGGGDGRSASVAASGEDDVATREYHLGDDLRRVHWRATRQDRRVDGPPRGTALAEPGDGAAGRTNRRPCRQRDHAGRLVLRMGGCRPRRRSPSTWPGPASRLRLLHGAVATNVGGAVPGQSGGSAEALAMADLATVTLGGDVDAGRGDRPAQRHPHRDPGRDPRTARCRAGPVAQPGAARSGRKGPGAPARHGFLDPAVAPGPDRRRQRSRCGTRSCSPWPAGGSPWWNAPVPWRRPGRRWGRHRPSRG